MEWISTMKQLPMVGQDHAKIFNFKDHNNSEVQAIEEVLEYVISKNLKLIDINT